MGLDGVTWFRQAAFRWQGDGPVVYVDPWGITDDVPADVILITHAHHDHLQPHEIERLRTSSTTIVAPRDVADGLTGDVMSIVSGRSCCERWFNCAGGGRDAGRLPPKM